MKNFKLEANEMLQRNELKSVFGGYGHLPTIGCPEDAPVECVCPGSNVVNCKESEPDCNFTCSSENN